MSDTTTTIVETEPDRAGLAAEPAAGNVAQVEAAAADASATHAAEAAQAAIAMADVAAAQVADNAAVELASYQERLAQCEAQSQSAIQSQTALLARLEASESRQAELIERLSSIQSRLEPPPEQHPENPPNGPSEAEVAAAEPEPPKRRAHRWI